MQCAYLLYIGMLGLMTCFIPISRAVGFVQSGNESHSPLKHSLGAVCHKGFLAMRNIWIGI